MADAEITGLDNLAHLASALKSAGEEGKGLRKELYAGLNRAAKPARLELNESIGQGLPHGHGLAAVVAKRAKFSLRISAAEKTTAVRFAPSGRSRPALRTSALFGYVRHPVFGNREAWVSQYKGVTAGLPEQRFEKAKPETQAEILQAIEDVRAKIFRSV